MTCNEAVKILIEEAGQIFVVNPWLIKENPKVLSEYGIDVKKCKAGKGIAHTCSYTDLKEKLETIKEMGYDDEVQKNPEDSLEVIRANRITINYNYKVDIGTQLKRSA